MHTLRTRVTRWMLAVACTVLITGAMVACGDDSGAGSGATGQGEGNDTADGSGNGNGNGGGGGGGDGATGSDDDASRDRAAEEAAIARHETLASLDWCAELDHDAVAAVVGEIYDVESDDSHTFGDPGCWFSTETDSYTIALPLPMSMDLAYYREDVADDLEGPFDLPGPGLGAVYTILPSEDQVNTLGLFVLAEPGVILRVKVDASRWGEAHDRTVALDQATALAELGLAVIAAN